MRKYLLPESGRFYKANLHCHSNLSDGNLTPEELKQAYKSHGYSILAITDHDGFFDHTDLNDDEFIAINAYEMEIESLPDQGEGFDKVVCTHLNFYARDPQNMKRVCYDPEFYHHKFTWCWNEELRSKIQYIGDRYVPEYTPECINEIIETANNNGFIVCLNHLQWSIEPYENFSRYKGMFATEIFNTGSYKSGIPENDEYLYDTLLRLDNKIFCIAADDNHNSYPLDSVYSDSFGGYVMIKADTLEYTSVFNALEKGDFYSSLGPEINSLYIEDGKIYIETSDASIIRLVTGNRYSQYRQAPLGESINSAEFDLRRISKYFRIEVQDVYGKKAYTNAYFIDELDI